MSEVAPAQVHFICVGTPQRTDSNAADLSYVEAAVAALVPLLRTHPDGRVVVVGKSTVPVETTERLAEQIAADAAGSGAVPVWNPEFLREGLAIQDTVAPDRIVYGLPSGSDGEEARDVVDAVYADLLARGIPRLTTDYATAQLVKVAANSFLAALGAAFKPDSDDVRDSPTLAVASMLNERGAAVVVTDPQALENVRRARPPAGHGALHDGGGRGSRAGPGAHRVTRVRGPGPRGGG